MKREFHVKTPMGDLHIYAKHENSDVMADYPGVYVELLREGCEPELLAGTEYDSGTRDMLTTVYDISAAMTRWLSIIIVNLPTQEERKMEMPNKESKCARFLRPDRNPYACFPAATAGSISAERIWL